MSRRATSRPRISARSVFLVAAVLGAGIAAVVLAGGASAKPPSLIARVVLDRSRVSVGGTVSGRVIFENRSSKPKLMLRGCIGGGLYVIGFRAADGYLEQIGWTIDGCRAEQSMVAKPGRTVFRFRTAARYTICGPSDQPKRSPGWIPACVAGGGDPMPPLPAGHYTAVFVPYSGWKGPKVKSATVRITQAR